MDPFGSQFLQNNNERKKHMKTKTNILYPAFTVFVLACFAVSPMARAVVPPPDGGYPGFNTAEGQNALFSLTTGAANTAVGWFSLFTDTTGSFNTGLGAGTLLGNVSGSNNTALGAAAGLNITGNSNICIGAGVTGNAGEANSIRIGDNLPSMEGISACYIGGIYGQVASVGLPVLINSSGKLGVILSSRRFKKDIKPMDEASEAILSLKPVTFHYKTDKQETPQFGLIAEEVAKVNQDLVVRDKDGEPLSVRYDQLNAMLLNEFLKEHRKNEEQQAIIEQQQKQIEALTAGLQKVSDQLELNKPAPQVVNNP
jgi:Chaperone of endosialidase